MDRLPAVIAASAALACASGCERASEGDEPAPSPGRARVAAVPAAEDTRTLEDLCDVLPDGDSAPVLAYPELSEDSGSPPSEGWRWINVWATWCKPCVEEIPMLREWAAELSAAGSPIEIVFLSVDDSAEAIAAYLEEYPDAPSDYRVADPAAVPAWLEGLGLTGGGSVPIHLVVDAGDRVRCLRGGKVSPRDFPLVERLLSGG